jgi:hypothetical protein
MKLFAINYPKKVEDFEKITFSTNKYNELIFQQTIEDSNKFVDFKEFKIVGAKKAPFCLQLSLLGKRAAL